MLRNPAQPSRRARRSSRSGSPCASCSASTRPSSGPKLESREFRAHLEELAPRRARRRPRRRPARIAASQLHRWRRRPPPQASRSIDSLPRSVIASLVMPTSSRRLRSSRAPSASGSTRSRPCAPPSPPASPTRAPRSSSRSAAPAERLGLPRARGASSRSSTRSSACGLASTSSTGSTSVGAIDGPTRRRLLEAKFACDVDAAPEGGVVFPGEAVLTVEGPFWQAQLVGGLVQAAISDATRRRHALRAPRRSRRAAPTSSRTARPPRTGSAAPRCSRAPRTSAAPAPRRAPWPRGATASPWPPSSRRASTLAVGDADRALRAWLAAAPAGGAVRLDARACRLDAAEARGGRARPQARLGGGLGRGPHRHRAARGRPRRAGASAVDAGFAEVGLEPPAILVSGDVDERLVLVASRRRARRCAASSLRAEGDAGDAARRALRARRHRERRLVVAAPACSVADAASSSEPGRKLLVRYVDAERPPGRRRRPRRRRAHPPRPGRPLRRPRHGPRRHASTPPPSAPLRAAVVRAGKRATRRSRRRCSATARERPSRPLDEAPAHRLARALPRGAHAAARRPEGGAARASARTADHGARAGCDAHAPSSAARAPQSQLTSDFRNVSMYLGRAFRKSM